MKENKNLDRLFQEKFKDFEATPDEKIWENIKFCINKKEKEKRRLIPFWLKLSGAAALMVIGFFVGNEYSENSINHIKLESNPKEDVFPDPAGIQNTVTSPSEKIKSNIQNIDSNNENLLNGNQARKLENVVGKNIVQTEKKDPTTNKSKHNAVYNKDENIQSLFKKSKEDLSEKKNIAYDNLEKINNIDPYKSIKNRFDKFEDILSWENNIAHDTQEKINQIPKTNKLIDFNKNDSKIKINTADSTKLVENKFISSEITDNFEAMSETKKEELKINELEEFLAQKELNKKKLNQSKTNRWQITSTIAPVFFGSTSNDSPIDAKYNSNSKNYENSMSYGVGIKYNLNKKLTFRAGINKLNFDFATNDVPFLENTKTVESLVAISNENTNTGIQIMFVQNGCIDCVDGFTLASNTVNNGTLRQEFGYYEIPFELSYAVIDKKFKVNIITGLSTLFLDENTISLTSTKYNMALGEANNVNKVNFSTNVGLGINYNLYKSFYLNLDSILKYQMNTFSSNSGDFNPYIIGLYSGLSYKF